MTTQKYSLLFKSLLTAIILSLLTACGGGGGSSETNPPASEALDTPTSVQLVQIAESQQLQLSWQAVTDAEFYTIKWSVDSIEATTQVTTSTNFIIEVTQHGIYQVQVQATKGEKTSNYSSIVSIQTFKTPILRVVQQSTSQMLIEWDIDSTTPTYTLSWGESESSLTDSQMITSGSYTHSNLSNNTTYYYQLKAETTDWTSKSAISSHTLLTSYPPLNIKLRQTSTNTINISWDKIETASSYTVYWSKTANNPSPNNSTLTTATNIDISSLEAGSTYYFSVSSFISDSESLRSAELDIRLLQIPAITKITQQATDELLIEWQVDPTVTTYTLVWGESESNLTNHIIVTGGSYTHNQPLIVSARYYYQLQAETTDWTSKSAISSVTISNLYKPKINQLRKKSTDSVMISWDSIETASTSSYIVYWSKTANQETPSNSTSTTETNIDIHSLEEGHTYYFSVSSFISDSESPRSTELSISLLEIPAITKITQQATDELLIEWQVDPMVTTYTLVWGDSENSLTDSQVVTGGSYTHNQPLIVSASYYYQLQAEITDWTSKSAISSVTISNWYQPNIRQVRQTDIDTINISWDNIETTSSYIVYWSKTANNPSANNSTLTTATGIDISSLEAGSTYYFSVSSFISDSESPRSTELSISLLQIPAITKITQQATDELLIEWQVDPTVTTYTLVWGESESNLTNHIIVTGGSYTHNQPLIVSARYYYQLQAETTNWTSKSAISSVTISNLYKPKINQLRKKSTDSVMISWDSIETASTSSYIVYWSKTANNPSANNSTLTTATGIDISSLEAGSTYYFSVSSFISDSESPRSTELSISLLQIPAITKITQQATDELLIEWQVDPMVTTYTLVWGDSESSLTDSQMITSGSYTHSNLSNNTTYYYQLKAETTDWTMISEISSHTLLTSYPPLNIKLRQTSTNTINISWDKIETASSYTVYWSKTANNPSPNNSTLTTATNIDISSLEAGSTYYFSVSSFISDSESLRSAELDIRLLQIPAITKITQQSTSQMLIEWDIDSTTPTYTLVWGESESNLTNHIIVTGGSYTHNQPLIVSARYYYQLQAETTDWTSKSAISSVTISNWYKPKINQLRKKSTDSVMISWDRVELADSYIVYWSKTANQETPSNSTSTTETNIDIHSLEEGHTYYFSVSSIISKIESTRSPEKKMGIIQTPMIKTLEQSSTNQVTIEWDTDLAVTTYTLHSGLSSISLTSNKIVFGGQYSHDNLLIGNTYYYQLQAEITDWTSKSAISSVTIRSNWYQPNIRQVRQTDIDTINISWDNIETTSSYIVYWSKTANNPSANNSTLTTATGIDISSLEAGSTYYFSVSSFISDSESPRSTELSISLLQIPAITKITQQATDGLLIEWQVDPMVTTYTLVWGDSENSLTDSQVVTGGSYTHNQPLIVSASYYYQLQAKIPGWTSLSEITSKTVSSNYPPINIQLKQTSTDSIMISWDGIEAASSYIVYWSKTADNQSADNINTQSITETSLIINNLDPESTYYFRVSSIIENTESEASEEISIKTLSIDDFLLLKGVETSCTNENLDSTLKDRLLSLSRLETGKQLVCHYLTPEGSGTANGDDWANASSVAALRDITSTLSNASKDNITLLLVKQGVYKPTDGDDRTKSFTMKDGVVIIGGWVGEGFSLSNSKTILSGDIGETGAENNGDNSYHVVYNDGSHSSLTSAAVLARVEVRDGNANGSFPHYNGGGIHNKNTNPLFIELSIVQNKANNYGGGVYNEYSAAQFSGVTISYNNSGDSGGGVYNSDSEAQFSGVTISSNEAYYGGGVFNYRSAAQFSGVTISSNEAVDGGGVYNGDSEAQFSGVTISSNEADRQGGAFFIDNDNKTVKLNNSLIWGNTDESGANQIYALTDGSDNEEIHSDNEEIHSDNEEIQLANVILQDGTSGISVSNQSLLILKGEDSVMTSNPNLGSLADNGGVVQTQAILTGSSAIDAGLYIRFFTENNSTTYFFSPGDDSNPDWENWKNWNWYTTGLDAIEGTVTALDANSDDQLKDSQAMTDGRGYLPTSSNPKPDIGAFEFNGSPSP